MNSPLDPNKFNTLFNGFDALVNVVTTEFFFTDENGEPEKNDNGQMKSPTAIHIHENMAEAQASMDCYNNMVRGKHKSVCKIGHSFNMSLRDIMEKCQGYYLIGTEHKYYVLQ